MLGNLSNGFLGLTLCIHVLLIAAEVHAENLRVGFAQLPVTPAVVDNWVDVNNDAQFDPDIDTWTDGNGNGTFDPVWIAGCLLYTSPSPRDLSTSRMPSSA